MPLSRIDYISERDKALYQAVKKALAEGATSLPQAVETAINSPTTSFWISPTQALKVIMHINNGYSFSTNVKSIHMEKYEELYRCYRNLLDTGAFVGRTMTELYEYLVEMPAPKFYLQAEYAVKIYQRQRKKEQWEKISRILR